MAVLKSELRTTVLTILSNELYERSETEVEELTEIILNKLCEDHEIEDDDDDEEESPVGEVVFGDDE